MDFSLTTSWIGMLVSEVDCMEEMNGKDCKLDFCEP